MVYTTNGIVLRTIKYGETSVVVNILTALFGMQSYLVNGVRTQGKNAKAHFFQPVSLLEMQVYHNDLKNLQRIKEVKWSYLYKNIFSVVIKNSVALYMAELLQKSMKQPETNENLFNFCEDAFIQLDMAAPEVTANFAIYFTIQLTNFLGIGILDNYSNERNMFSVSEARFINKAFATEPDMDEHRAYTLSQLLKVRHPTELNEIRLNKNIRWSILGILESYYLYHIADFSTLKTLPVLHELMG